MLRRSFAVVFFLTIWAGSAAALTREARSCFVSDIHFGYSSPFGSYTGIGPREFGLPEIDAADLFDPTYHVGFGFSRLQENQVLAGVGFRYTKINIHEANFPSDSEFLKFNQYDLFFDYNYYLTNLFNESFAPYFGGEVLAGLTSFTPPGFRSETQLSIGLAVNFGADFKVWSATDKRSFVTLASVNSWQLVGSGNRPRYLNIGGGIRYFFRP